MTAFAVSETSSSDLPSTEGRLTARPVALTRSCVPGTRGLGLDSRRDALLFVPRAASTSAPMPLVVLLHGSGGKAEDIIGLIRRQAERKGFALLVPNARKYTWDVVLDGFGDDVRFIDRALQRTFSQCNIDPSRIAVAGFSDGASYALSLGMTNGRLFRQILAFSPGFASPGPEQGHPKIFISHGTNDRVLPIARCSRRVVPRLESEGYAVDYHEFDGEHEVPAAIVEEAVQAFLGNS